MSVAPQNEAKRDRFAYRTGFRSKDLEPKKCFGVELPSILFMSTTNKDIRRYVQEGEMCAAKGVGPTFTP